MIEMIKSIILDFQEIRLETGVPRRLRIETVHGRTGPENGNHRDAERGRADGCWRRRRGH